MARDYDVTESSFRKNIERAGRIAFSPYRVVSTVRRVKNSDGFMDRYLPVDGDSQTWRSNSNIPGTILGVLGLGLQGIIGANLALTGHADKVLMILGISNGVDVAANVLEPILNLTYTAQEEVRRLLTGSYVEKIVEED